MAQVVPGADVGARIDHFLDDALREWSSVPDYVERFPTWSALEQLDVEHEWAIRESALQTLRDRAISMSAHQKALHKEIRRVVARYRPMGQRLIQEERGATWRAAH